jgi:glucosamine--fructose-6-phosphate aminotransferase (isomerizing)
VSILIQYFINYMCGIIGYIGPKQAAPMLIQGLRKLEYRGYDSAGFAVMSDGQIDRVRAVGAIDALAREANKTDHPGTTGIAHTRWATHGGVTEANAHPHTALGGQLVLCHNGIIENYRELKAELEQDGVVFHSETDTEVLAALIGATYSGDLRAAVVAALTKVHGTYGIAVMHADHPNEIVGARMGSPLVIGMLDDGYVLASDATPVLPHTKQVVYLDDGEIVRLTRDDIEITNRSSELLHKPIEEITWDAQEAEKQGFDHFMIKEIHDQPQVFLDAIRGRIDEKNGTAKLGGLNLTEEQMRMITRVVFVGCGTAGHAGHVGKYAFERLAGIPTEVDVASEFRYRDPVLDDRTLVFVLSQSGETADTLAALREAKRKGAIVRGIVNVIGSTIARETDGGTYIHAGPELSVASTKAYTNMVAVILLYALQFGRNRSLSVADGQAIIRAMLALPDQMHAVFQQAEAIQAIAQSWKNYEHCLFLGRGVNCVTAMEGSLKLKEITYVHSEAYPGGEMKHGPLALLSESFPVIALLIRGEQFEKMKSNIEEVRARGVSVLGIVTEGCDEAPLLADQVIAVPETIALLQPILNVIPLQLFSYYLAVALERNVDRPRNLAKSVTVE